MERKDGKEGVKRNPAERGGGGGGEVDGGRTDGKRKGKMF